MNEGRLFFAGLFGTFFSQITFYSFHNWYFCSFGKNLHLTLWLWPCDLWMIHTVFNSQLEASHIQWRHSIGDRNGRQTDPRVADACLWHHWGRRRSSAWTDPVLTNSDCCLNTSICLSKVNKSTCGAWGSDKTSLKIEPLVSEVFFSLVITLPESHNITDAGDFFVLFRRPWKFGHIV